MRRTRRGSAVLCFVLMSPILLGQALSQQRYYDDRERVAEKYTFEWSRVTYKKFSEEFVDMMNNLKISQALSVGAPLENIRLLDKNALLSTVFEVPSNYTIERTPQWTRVHRSYRCVSLEKARLEDEWDQEEAYFGGQTVIVVFRDDTGKVSSIDIAESKLDALGWGDNRNVIDPVTLVLCAGVSPFRLYGSTPDCWKLVSCSPDEWVFELSAKDLATKTEAFTEIEDSLPIRIHLNRRRHDALAKIEVHDPGGAVFVGQVKRYVQIEGVWFPSEIECYYDSFDKSESLSKLVLVGHRRTRSITFPEIAEGTYVRDWRRFGDKAFVEWEIEHDELEWTSSLGQSLGWPLAAPSQK